MRHMRVYCQGKHANPRALWSSWNVWVDMSWMVTVHLSPLLLGVGSTAVTPDAVHHVGQITINLPSDALVQQFHLYCIVF